MKSLKKMVLAVLALTMLVGCGGNQKANNENQIVFAKENDISTLDLKSASTGMDFEIINACNDGLVALDKDNKIVPAIAESWEVEEGVKYTFKLRDAKWTNGDPVTAQDFVYSWQRTIVDGEDYRYFFTDDMACIKNGNEVYAGELPVDDLGIKAIDEKTLEITLSKPTPYFLSLLAFPTSFALNQKFVESCGDQYALSPENFLGNGAYTLTSYVKGSNLVLDKNETYWDAANVKAESLKFNIVKEAATAALDFDSGKCDFTAINSSLVDKYKDTDNYNSFLGGYLWFLQFNMENEILANANVRKALTLAVDRDDLTQNVLKDGSVSARGFVPQKFAYGPDNKDYCETAPKFVSTNIEEAKKCWAEAKKELGMDAIELELLYETSDPAKPAAEYIQAKLTENLEGLTITMNGVEKKTRTTLQQEGKFAVTLTRWGPDYADPTTYLTLLTDGHYFNYGKWANAKYDDLAAKISNEKDVEARWQYCKDAEAVLFEDGNYPVAPLFQTGGAVLVNPELTGLEDHSFGTPYIYKNVAK